MPPTPGPWSANEDDMRGIIKPSLAVRAPLANGGSTTIAVAVSEEPGMHERATLLANARLIAKAPEMRALLEECMTYLQERPIRDAVRALLAETE